jgi:hypothetical protein
MKAKADAAAAAAKKAADDAAAAAKLKHEQELAAQHKKNQEEAKKLAEGYAAAEKAKDAKHKAELVAAKAEGNLKSNYITPEQLGKYNKDAKYGYDMALKFKTSDPFISESHLAWLKKAGFIVDDAGRITPLPSTAWAFPTKPTGPIPKATTVSAVKVAPTPTRHDLSRLSAYQQGFSPYSQEYRAIDHYKGSGYEPVNRGLRKGVFDAPVYKDQAATITEVMRASKTTEEMTLYRGMKTLPKGLTLVDAAGFVFEDGGFGSSSIDLKTAHKFSEYGANPVIMRFTYPKGREAIAIGKALNKPEDYEFEFLLPAGTTYRLTGTSAKINNILVYDVEVLPPGVKV